MDVYWSIEQCGWVPSRGPQDPLATPWSLASAPKPKVAVPVPDLPVQRETSPGAAVPR